MAFFLGTPRFFTGDPVKNRYIGRRFCKLKKSNMRAKFQEGVEELVDDNASNIWNAFKNDISKACDEVCEKKKGGRNYGDT